MHELKRRLRTAAPGVFRAVSALWRTPVPAYLFHLQRRLRMRRLVRTSDGAFGFDMSGTIGLGATLSNAVPLLAYCDQTGLIPRVRFTNPLYRAPGSDDWFTNYFEFKRSVAPLSPERERSLEYAAVGSAYDYGIKGLELDLTLERANAAFNKYIALGRDVLEEANSFAAANGLDHTSIGVHFRGTDKAEAPKVDRAAMFDALKVVAGATPDTKIFFATDEPDLIEAARRGEFSHRLVVYECQEIYPDGRAAHLTSGDGYRKGFEAVVTILLLAKCGVVIRTSSHLSAWANILNLEQKVVMLSRPFDAFMHFPDAEVWKHSWDPQQLAQALRAGG